MSVTTATKHVGVGIPKVISLFEISDNNIWFVPSAISKRLKGTNKSAKLSYFLEAMKPFLTSGQTPYVEMRKFYKLNTNIMTTNRKSFVNTMVKIKEIIQD